MSKLSKTPRFKKMYRRGYMFEKKTRAVINTILSAIPNLLFYIIESRGSKGKADLVVGLCYLGKRTWIGVQCKKGYVSMPQQKREIQAALKDNGMIMFFATNKDTTKEYPVNFYPEFKSYVEAWKNTLD